MRILSLEIQDILSIQNATIAFDDSGLVLIEGWNYDDQRANGAGKTAIFNGMSFALYDKLPRKVTASEIVRRGCKSGFVEVSVLCGEDEWKVKRSRPKGVKFSKNGVEQSITQEEFEGYIRLNYEQFLLTIYTPQANSKSTQRFLSSPDSLKKEFLLQLLNLDAFSSAKRATDSLIESREAAIAFEERKISSYRAKISAYEESMVDVDSLKASVDALQLSILESNREILELSNVTKPDLTKYSQMESEFKSRMMAIAQAKMKRSMLHDRFKELSASLMDYNAEATCDECGSSLDTPQARISHSAVHEKAKQKLKETKSLIDDADSLIAKEHSIAEYLKKLEEKKSEESRSFQDANGRLRDLRAFVQNKQNQIENIRLKLDLNSELLNKINNLETLNAKCNDIILSNKKELELYKALSAVYSPTGAQAYVLDSIVDSFNEVIQKYIDLMSPNMTYILNSFKETSKGDIVAKFSETLTKSGEEVSVGSLSGGEEKGLSLCVDFTLLEVLETQFGMTLNPIILDEPFDGLDNAGREIVIGLLESLSQNRQIFVIDHSSEARAMFTKSIKVELKNKISTVTAQI